MKITKDMHMKSFSGVICGHPISIGIIVCIDDSISYLLSSEYGWELGDNLQYHDISIDDKNKIKELGYNKVWAIPSLGYCDIKLIDNIMEFNDLEW